MNPHSSPIRFLRACIAFAGLLIYASLSSAQVAGTGTIQGRVLNAATGAYLGNAEVRIAGTDLVTTTTPDGRYLFTQVPAGTQTVSVSYPGLDKLEQPVNVPASAAANLDFSLTSGQYGQVVRLGEFVVGGAREGNARAIVDQRVAPNITNVISADAFGAVSEDNIGEFLKYMPGLTIDYVENDARTVRVRGMSSKYASVLIDGNPVAAADVGIGTGRDFQFEQVSLSTVDTIELSKTPLADQPANSLAGSINVKSKSALNQKGRRINYNANMTFNEYAFHLGKSIGWDNQERWKALPGGSLEFSDTFMNDRLGVVVSANHTGTYVEQKIIAALGRTFNANPADNDTEIPRISSVNWQDGLKPTFRDALLVNLDFKATPDLILSLRTSYNYYNAPFHNRNWTFAAATTAASQPDAPSATSMRTIATNATDTTNTVTTAGTNFRKYGATFLINPALNWKLTPTTTLDASTAYSRSYQWYDSDAEGYFNVVSARMRGVSWSYASDRNEPNLQLKQNANRIDGSTDTRSFFDLANYNDSAAVTLAHRDSKDQTFNVRADATVRLSQLRAPTVLKFGGYSSLLVKDIDTWTKNWTMNVDPTRPGFINLANYNDPYHPSFNKGETITDVRGVVGSAASTDKWRLYDLFAQGNVDPLFGPQATAANATTPFFLTTAQAAANLRNKLQSMFDFKETIHSAYAMANSKLTRKIQVVGGLRFESTDSQGKAFDDIGNVKAAAQSRTTDINNFDYIQARYGTRRTKTQSYDDLFPSAQVRYSATNNLIVRGAFYRSVLRPDPQNLSRSLTVSDNELAFATANPDLQPEYSSNYDTRVEYYFEPVGVLSAGFFYKEIKDAQISTTSLFSAGDVPQDILDLGYTEAGLLASGAQFTRVTNGGSAIVRGFELEYSQQLSFLPGVFRGLGVFANYTRTTTSNPGLFTGGSGVPKDSINAGVNYTLKAFSGGVKFNWVGERILTVPGANGIGNYERERLQIDVNAAYKLHRRATVFMNIANLTAAPSYRYNNNTAFMNRHGAFGAKYTFGLRGSF
jgi:iron complex outermembrane recepter protein